MWLFPGMFGGGQESPPLGQKGEKAKDWARILLVAQIIVAFSELLLIAPMKGLMELLTAVILFWGLSSNNTWMVLVYNIMILFNTVQIFAQLSLFVQNSISSEEFKSDMKQTNISNTFFTIYLSFLFVFYIFAIVVSFFYYREWKQANYNIMSGLSPDYGNNEPSRQNQ
mgnify:CR=1 FL=1